MFLLFKILLNIMLHNFFDLVNFFVIYRDLILFEHLLLIKWMFQ
jgi:hypothetical protein